MILELDTNSLVDSADGNVESMDVGSWIEVALVVAEASSALKKAGTLTKVDENMAGTVNDCALVGVVDFGSKVVVPVARRVAVCDEGVKLEKVVVMVEVRRGTLLVSKETFGGVV